jgi:hypothetical protein
MTFNAYLSGTLNRTIRTAYSGINTFVVRISKICISSNPPWEEHAAQLGPTFSGATQDQAAESARAWAEIHLADLKHLFAWEESRVPGALRNAIDFSRAPVDGIAVVHEGSSYLARRVKCQGCGRSCRALQTLTARANLIEWPVLAPWAALSVAGPGAIRLACPRCLDAHHLQRSQVPALPTL